MASNIIKRVWNQSKMVQVEDLTGAAFQAEAGGHVFKISGIDGDGGSVSLEGSVSAAFIRPDGATVALIGSSSDGVVSIALTEECYAIPGRFSLIVFVTSGETKTAVYACVGSIMTTSTGVVPGSTAATVQDLIDAIEAAVQDLDDVAAQTSADAAAAAASAAAAQASAGEIEDLTVSAETLAPGTPASVQKTIVSGVVHLLFGIPKGDPLTISSWSVTYQGSTSGTTVPTGTWDDTPPSVAQGGYLWTRIVTSYSDGTTTTAYTVSRFGIDGAGSVSSVNGVSPDGSGNVQLYPADVGAVPGLSVSATVSAAGWYRVLTHAGAFPDGSMIKFRIGRNQNGECHEIDLLVPHDEAFVNEVSKTGTDIGVTKIRVTADANNRHVDVYMALSVSSLLSVAFEPSGTITQTNVTAGTLQAVADAPAGETVLTEYVFAQNTSIVDVVTSGSDRHSYRRSGNVVVIGMQSLGGTSLPQNVHTTVATLPVGLRPLEAINFAADNTGGTTNIGGKIEPNGNVDLYAANASTSYWRFSVSYIV